MYNDRPDGARWFARLVALELECPQCAHVYALHDRTALATWNRRTARFQCPRCRCRLALGVLAYPIDQAGAHFETLILPAADALPTYRQQLALRQHYESLLRQPLLSADAPRNVVLRRGCRCERLAATGALWIHPQCPIHSVRPPPPTTGPTGGP